MKLRISVPIAAAALLFACSKSEEKPAETAPAVEKPAEVAPPAPPPSTPPPAPAAPTFQMPTDLQKTKSGLQYKIEQDGTGPQPQKGQKVWVHYTGWLTNGTKFDSSRDRRSPIDFVLGKGEVIEGWDEGVGMMKVGERRWLVIPPALGYGSEGDAVIPANSTLVFHVELMKVQ